MRTKTISIFIFLLIILLPFSISDRSDDINPKTLDETTVGFYQSTTCSISLFEFVIKNLNNETSIYYNNNDYVDINCYGKITGVDLNGDTFFVSIGTNSSINLILQSSIWLLLFYLIPKHKNNNSLNFLSSLLIPLIFIFQFISEERFYRRTNVLYDSKFEINNC